MPNKINNGIKKISAARNLTDALNLRAAGRSYRDIADEMGVSYQTVKRWCDEGIKQMYQEGGEAALALEMDRLDTEYHRAETNYKRLETIIVKAMDQWEVEVGPGDVGDDADESMGPADRSKDKATGLVRTIVNSIRNQSENTKLKLSISEARRKMLGLDAPQKIDVEHDLAALSDHELFERREALLARMRQIHEEEKAEILPALPPKERDDPESGSESGA